MAILKKLWVSTASLAMLFTLTSCSRQTQEQETADGLGSYQFAEYADVLEKAKTDWELALPGFQQDHQDRAALDSIEEISEPEYQMGTDGIYYSSGDEDDDVATIMLTGDLMCQSKQQTAAMESYGVYSFSDSFYYVKKIFSEADFVVGNLETCLSESSSYMSEEYQVDDRYNCNAPSTYLDALTYAGFDMVVTANNHDCDTGITGLFQTLCHLDQYGLLHTGTFRTADEPRYVIAEIDGIKVGFLAYATYFNKIESNWSEEGQSVLLNAYSQERVKADVAAAKEAGAEYIIAYNHWGKEYTNTSSAKEQQYAQEMADAGVDYIVGSHPHALQEYDILTASDGRQVPVLYSLGNFVSHQTKTISKENVILKIELVRDSSGNIVLQDDGYIPCRVYKTYSSRNYAIVPVGLPYSENYTSKYFASAWDDITAVIGDELEPIGSRNSSGKQAEEQEDSEEAESAEN